MTTMKNMETRTLTDYAMWFQSKTTEKENMFLYERHNEVSVIILE